MSDKAYAAYFGKLIEHFVISGFAPVGGIEKKEWSSPYFDAAKICRWEAQHGLILRGLPPPHNELEHALTIVAKHLDNQAKMRSGEAGNGIYFVDRKKVKEENKQYNTIRVACRLIAKEHNLLFGLSLCGTVKTIAKIIYNADLDIESVENWAKEGAKYATE